MASARSVPGSAVPLTTAARAQGLSLASDLKQPLNIPPIVLRDFRVNNYVYVYSTEGGDILTTQSSEEELLLTEAGT